MLGRNETQIGHELAGIGETGDVAEFRHQRRRGHQRQATPRLQRPPDLRSRPPAPGPAALAALSGLASAPSPPARFRCGLQAGPAEPSPPRRPRYNLPARCNARRARTLIRPTSADALGSRPAGYNDDHGAARSQTVAGAPAATRAPQPVARAPDRE